METKRKGGVEKIREREKGYFYKNQVKVV